MDFRSIKEWYEMTYPYILNELKVRNDKVKISSKEWNQIQQHSKDCDFYNHISEMGAKKLMIGWYEIDVLSLNLPEEEKRTPKNVLTYQGMFKSESTCGKCNLPWSSCKPCHSINLNENLGVFAMCQHCWENSNIEEIKVYYYLVFREHELEYAKSGQQYEYTWEYWAKCIEEDYELNHK